MDWKRLLADRLTQLRRERNMTQELLAERTGYHLTHIAKLESGARLPSVDALIRLADALDVPVASLFATVDDGRLGRRPTSADLDPGMVENGTGSCSEREKALLFDLLRVIRKHRT